MMLKNMKKPILIAGINGAGKSTRYQSLKVYMLCQG